MLTPPQAHFTSPSLANRFVSATALSVLIFTGALTPQGANAIIMATATENAGDVIFSYTGSITDLEGFKLVGNVSIDESSINPAQSFLIGGGESNGIYEEVSVEGPSNFGTGTDTTVANVEGGGSVFALVFAPDPLIIIPSSYTLGSTISASATYSRKTLASLGVTPGTYVWTLGNTARDTVTLTATAVPLESDALPLVGATLFFAGGVWWKKKRAQAKVAEFMDKK